MNAAILIHSTHQRDLFAVGTAGRIFLACLLLLVGSILRYAAR